MQSHEERADDMLRVMGGSLSPPAQRVVLRRLILAEDSVVEYQTLVRQQQASLDTLLKMQELHHTLRAALEGLVAEIGGDWPDSWDARAYDEAIAAIAKAEES